MPGEELVQPRQIGNDIFLVAPGKTGAAVHQNSFGGEPFDAAGETVGAVRARQRAQPVAQQRPFAAFFREPVVVVRFALMRQHADARALLVRMVEIAGGLRAGNFLEQL